MQEDEGQQPSPDWQEQLLAAVMEESRQEVAAEVAAAEAGGGEDITEAGWLPK